MSDPNDLLSADTSTSSTDTITYLDRLVGEGKQFKDVEAVAKGKVESDNFIKQLQRENAQMVDKMKELETKANAKVAITDVLNELKNRAPTESGGTTTGISDEELAQKVRNLMDGREVEKTVAANKAAANALLLKKFNGDGEAAKKFLATRRSELNLSPEAVENVAKSSPQAFAELLGLTTREATKANVHIPNSQGGTTPSGDGTRNQAYYNGLLKTMGSSKFFASKDVLNQREQDMTRLGEAFFA